MNVVDTILVYGIFGVFTILVIWNIFNNLANVSKTVRKNLQAFHKRGLVRDVLITGLKFALLSFFFYIAGKYALLSYLWYALSIVFLLFTTLCLMVTGFWTTHRNEIPKIYKPIEIGQEFISKKVKRRRQISIIKLVILAVWLYSWYPVLAQPR